MLQANHRANAAAAGQIPQADHLVGQGTDSSHQVLLDALVEWRTQSNLPGLVAEHRDLASRLIEQFLKDSNSPILNLRAGLV